jgi:WD40 repeat protein
MVGDTLLTSWSTDGAITYWRYQLGQLIVTPLMSFKAGNPSPISFSSDGKLMASGLIGNWARLWQPMERKVYQELFGHKNSVTGCTFGMNDNVLFTASMDGNIIRWQKDAPLVNVSVQKKDSVIPPPVIKKPDELKITSAPIAAEVKMTSQNVPEIVRGRKVLNTKDLEVRSNHLRIFVYDNSYLDGDTMSLFFNGKWILNGYGVTKKKKEIELDLLPNTNNYLVLFANNLGKSPPNTAAVEIVDGNERRIFRLSSDLSSCSAINFVYRP